jgi:hypothetical protein
VPASAGPYETPGAGAVASRGPLLTQMAALRVEIMIGVTSFLVVAIPALLYIMLR